MKFTHYLLTKMPLLAVLFPIVAYCNDEVMNNFQYSSESVRHNEVVQGNIVDLSTLTANYEAQDNDILTGKLSTKLYISIAPDATVTLRNATISDDDRENFMFQHDFLPSIKCLGNATIIIEDGTNNLVRSSGKQNAGIQIGKAGTKLIIKGGPEGTGKLEVIGSGAGIGAGPDEGDYDEYGDIEINGGIITVKADERFAGIGAGHTANCGNIIINGGNISVTGGLVASAIGAGSASNCKDITINGGTISAVAFQQGTGIGGTSQYDEDSIGYCGNITINGGIITATGALEGSGIGTKCKDIYINNCTLTAKGGQCSAGIGSNDACGNITIAGGIIEVNGGSYAAAIGSGCSGVCGDITISNDVTEIKVIKGVGHGECIGKGEHGECGKVMVVGQEGNITGTTYNYKK
ncbi:MAG: hypothetical protein IKQ70_00685 [Bacteroidales bacterium]|nr:hypothetical protein [Bacteroidales bacterium]